MRPTISPLFVLILTLIIVTMPFQACQRDQGASSVPDPTSLPTGGEVVNRYLKYQSCHNAELKVNARLTEADGTEREFTIMTYQKCVDGTQYTLRQVASPESERARALLSIERPEQPVENVAYLPGFNKFVEVQDLTREDTLFGLSIQESLGGYELYDYKTLGTERIGQYDTYKVGGQLKPEAASRFARTLTYYRQDNYLPVRMELYNAQDELVRVRRYTDWARIDGRWTEQRTDVDNLKHQKRIVFETVEADYNVDLPLAFFSRDNLKKLVGGSQ